MLSQECKDGSCGFIRPGTVAHRKKTLIVGRNPSLMQIDGFDGADKVFLFEFSMPMDGTSGFNADMPAIVRNFCTQLNASPGVPLDQNVTLILLNLEYLLDRAN